MRLFFRRGAHKANPDKDTHMSEDPGLSMGQDEDILLMTTEIVAAYAGRNQMSQTELPDLITSVHKTISGLSGGTAAAEAQKSL